MVQSTNSHSQVFEIDEMKSLYKRCHFPIQIHRNSSQCSLECMYRIIKYGEQNIEESTTTINQ